MSLQADGATGSHDEVVADDIVSLGARSHDIDAAEPGAVERDANAPAADDEVVPLGRPSPRRAGAAAPGRPPLRTPRALGRPRHSWLLAGAALAVAVLVGVGALALVPDAAPPLPPAISPEQPTTRSVVPAAPSIAEKLAASALKAKTAREARARRAAQRARRARATRRRVAARVRRARAARRASAARRATSPRRTAPAPPPVAPGRPPPAVAPPPPVSPTCIEFGPC